MRPTTVDAVIKENKKIVLIKRGTEPFLGKWALPGGFVDSGETTEEACIREAGEETGLKIDILKLIGVFSEPSRDISRGTISIAYLCKNTGGKLVGGDDATEAKWFSLEKLPEIAFDHKKIIEKVEK